MSSSKDPDFISVTFKVPSVFLSLEFGIGIDEPFYIQRTIPPQLSDENEAAAENKAELAQAGMLATLFSLVIFAPFPVIVQGLLGSIKDIGPLLHTFLINVSTSAMGSAFLTALVDLFTFDPIPMEDYYDAMFEPTCEPITVSFE